MRSSFTNLLSVDEFAKMALVDPWVMAGFCTDCREKNNVIPQTMFQGKYLSRDEISEAIQTAESLITDELGYPPAPVQYLETRVDYPVSQTARGVRGRSGKYKSVLLPKHHLIALGKYTYTALGEVSLTRALNTFTATVPLSSEPPADSEWLVYYTETDRAGDDLEYWQIRPVKAVVTEAAGVYTLTLQGANYLLLHPDKMKPRKAVCADPASADSYITSIEVWRRNFDTTQPGSLIWKGVNCFGERCTEYRRGFCGERLDTPLYPEVRLIPAEWSGAGWVGYCRPYSPAPSHALINYVAGAPLVKGRMSPRYARAVFELAASLLESDLPDCQCDENVRRALSRLRDVEKTILRDRAEGEQELTMSERVVTRNKQMESAWGGRLGAVRAWTMIQSIKQSEGY